MALLSQARRCGVIAAMLVAGTLLVSLPAAAQGTIENEVKAAYLFHFTKFVRWPAASNPADPFRLCVAGDPDFAAALDAVIAGESADGRPLVRLDGNSAETARTCQILYIGPHSPDGGRALLAAVRGQPVLTVGNAPGFSEQEGMIHFVVSEGRVRFDVNLAAAQRAGLQVSSKLLRVARRRTGATP
jgi:hypothetical protein